jgi:hypothetical protein
MPTDRREQGEDCGKHNDKQKKTGGERPQHDLPSRADPVTLGASAVRLPTTKRVHQA